MFKMLLLKTVLKSSYYVSVTVLICILCIDLLCFIFSSHELKTNVRYSDQHLSAVWLSSVVCKPITFRLLWNHWATFNQLWLETYFGDGDGLTLLGPTNGRGQKSSSHEALAGIHW